MPNTLTRTRGLRGILDDLPPRGLPIPAPPGRREEVVQTALDELKAAYADDREKAEETIEKYGLSIEVARLHDKLARSATTELQRLLLSTPGVPEKLLNDAIKKQLEGAEQPDDDVKDQSVVEIVKKLDELVTALEKLDPGSVGGSTGGDGHAKVGAKPAGDEDAEAPAEAPAEGAAAGGAAAAPAKPASRRRGSTRP